MDAVRASLQSCASIILDFLQSKGLFAAERALRTELDANYLRQASFNEVLSRNLWQSQIELMLNVKVPRLGEDDRSPEMLTLLSQLDSIHMSSGSTPTIWHYPLNTDHGDAGSSCRSTPSRRLGVRLHQLNPAVNSEETALLRKQRNRSAQQSCVVFREGIPLTEAQSREVQTLLLPLLYNPHIRGLEDSPELILDENTVIAGRYRIVALIGKGSFSRVVQCYDLKAGRSVSVKVLHNDKDCIDQGIGEIRLLSLIAKRDPNGEVRSYITA